LKQGATLSRAERASAAVDWQRPPQLLSLSSVDEITEKCEITEDSVMSLRLIQRNGALREVLREYRDSFTIASQNVKESTMSLDDFEVRDPLSRLM